MAAMYCVADYVQKIIFINKPFATAAKVIGSKEYEELLTLRRDYPDYKVELRTITKNPHKQSHHGLTYEKMAEHITRSYKADKAQRLEELEDMKYRAGFQKGSYAIVKKWFLEKYGKDLEIKHADLAEEPADTTDNVIPMTAQN